MCVCVHSQKHLLSSVGFIINDEFELAASFTQGSSFAFSLRVSRPLKLTPGAGEDVQSTDETLHPACPIPAGSGPRS